MMLLALACAACHPAIVAAYEASPMAHSSGSVTSLPAGSYRHFASQTAVSIESRDRVNIRRPLQAPIRRLRCLLDSNTHGRSDLFHRGAKTVR